MERRARCLTVALAGTAALWGAAAVTVRALAGAEPASAPDQALVQLCLAALALAAVWAWVQVVAGVADAWRGTPRVGAGAVRRLALLACGAVVVAGALASPAGADPIDGLPLPDRPEGGRAHDRTVVVHQGDTLWAIAVADLGGRPSDRAVSARWREVYAANRGVVGPDPDLVLPGQVLRLQDRGGLR